MGWRSRRRARKWLRVAGFGVSPILAGVATLWDAIQRKQRLALAPPPETPFTMRRMPWDQQLYLIEIFASFTLILAGVLITVVLLSRRRG